MPLCEQKGIKFQENVLLYSALEFGGKMRNNIEKKIFHFYIETWNS